MDTQARADRQCRPKGRTNLHFQSSCEWNVDLLVAQVGIIQLPLGAHVCFFHLWTLHPQNIPFWSAYTKQYLCKSPKPLIQTVSWWPVSDSSSLQAVASHRKTSAMWERVAIIQDGLEKTGHSILYNFIKSNLRFILHGSLKIPATDHVFSYRREIDGERIS